MVAQFTTLRLMANAERRSCLNRSRPLHETWKTCLSAPNIGAATKVKTSKTSTGFATRPIGSNDMVPESETPHRSMTISTRRPTVYRFGIYVDQRLVSTLRIHHVTPDMPSRLDQGVRRHRLSDARNGDTFVCPSRFAVRSGMDARLSAVALCDASAGADGVLSFPRALLPFHGARGPRRLLQADLPVASGSASRAPIPASINKVVLYRTNAHANKERFFKRFPFFKSTPVEQRCCLPSRPRANSPR